MTSNSLSFCLPLRLRGGDQASSKVSVRRFELRKRRNRLTKDLWRWWLLANKIWIETAIDIFSKTHAAWYCLSHCELCTESVIRKKGHILIHFYILVRSDPTNKHYICVSKAWYNVFLRAVALHCPKNYLKHQWATELQWVTCFFNAMNMSTWVSFFQ